MKNIELNGELYNAEIIKGDRYIIFYQNEKLKKHYVTYIWDDGEIDDNRIREFIKYDFDTRI